MRYKLVFKCSSIYYDYVLKKVFQSNIDILNVKQKKNEYYFLVYEEDYQKLISYDYRKEIIFVGYSGLYNFISVIKYNVLYIIITLIVTVLVFLSNILILKVNIHTDDINLNRKIMYFLIDSKIDNFSIKRSYLYLQNVKRKLLDKYHDEIEWIEIAKNGYEYDIYLIKRKKNKTNNSKSKCNYIAKKSGTITRIKVSRGVLLVQENNYVNQGDILISGDIMYNDELKNEVCAQGKIYGEVWYEVDMSYPLEKTYIAENKLKFYNISLRLFNKNYYIFKNKYSEYKIVKKIGNNIFGLNIIKSYRINKKMYKISEEEAEKIMLKKAEKSVKLKSKNVSKIISQNILKKYTKNGTIYMKVLLTVEEELGVVESY